MLIDLIIDDLRVKSSDFIPTTLHLWLRLPEGMFVVSSPPLSSAYGGGEQHYHLIT